MDFPCSLSRHAGDCGAIHCVLLSREEDIRKAKEKRMEEVHKAMENERNIGDEGFVEDYSDHDHQDEERVELSHPDNLSTSSQDDAEEVTHVVHCSVQTHNLPHL